MILRKRRQRSDPTNRSVQRLPIDCPGCGRHISFPVVVRAVIIGDLGLLVEVEPVGSHVCIPSDLVNS